MTLVSRIKSSIAPLLPPYAHRRLKQRRTQRILAHQFGQLRSFMEDKAVDHAGNPLPWYTYPAIEYLTNFDFSNSDVMEFGSGRSTLYWASRCRSVTAVDSNQEWFAKIKSLTPNNVILTLETGRDGYLQALTKSPKAFDVIVVDGDWRSECLEAAIAHANPGKIIILDNSDGLPDCCRMMREAGLFQIDFSGFGPQNDHCWTTSMFVDGDTRLQATGYSVKRPIGSPNASN
jgi:hypothetical protein